jgi:hypothetical protein
MSGGDRAAVDDDASRNRSQDEPGLDGGREIATDGGHRHHRTEDSHNHSTEDSHNHSTEDSGDHTAGTDHSSTARTDYDSTPESTREEPLETSDGQALSERSRQQIEEEVDELEQNPEQYETQDQAVIDHYEGLLAERQHRKRRTEADQETDYRRRLRKLKGWILRTVGLR